MAQHGKPDALVTLQELAVSKAYEMEALVAGLEWKGLITQGEVLEKIKRLKERTGTVRSKHPERRGGPRRSGVNVLCVPPSSLLREPFRINGRAERPGP